MTGLLTVNEARVKYLDFSEPLYMEQIQVAVKRPVLEPDVAGFVKPLSESVSVCSIQVKIKFIVYFTRSDVFNRGLTLNAFGFSIYIEV